MISINSSYKIQSLNPFNFILVNPFYHSCSSFVNKLTAQSEVSKTKKTKQAQIIKFLTYQSIEIDFEQKTQMSSIQSLGISGVRGYSPQNFQKIEFMKPLTLIWGKNGSGKTTIIECLKYITTGSLPPNSDKGKSFVMDTKVAGKPEVISDIRLIFKTGGRGILAKRRMALSAKGNTTKFQSIQQVLKTKNQNGQELTINHQCAQIQKQVPQFLGISRPILQNIVFCHQDESLWPFGDSVLLKNIFDELFETKQITKQMERMWQIHKDQQSQLKQLKIRLEYQKERFTKQLQTRSKSFLQLQEIKLKATKMQHQKKQILAMKGQLNGNSQISKDKERLIFKKGRLENSVNSLQARIRAWKQSMIKIETQFESRIEGKKNMMEEDEFSLSRSNNMGFTQQRRLSSPVDLSTVRMMEIQSSQRAMQELQYKRQFYKQLFQKHNSIKEQYDNMRMFKQTSKLQQEIKSEQQRVKTLLPELKYNREIKNNEDFLRVLKQILTEMEQKAQGKEINRRKFEKLEIPTLVEMGFNEKQVQELNRESRELQEQIKLASVSILKVYKQQHKPIPEQVSSRLNPSSLSQGPTLQSQLQSISTILTSKQQQLLHYQQLSTSPSHIDQTNLQKQIRHYRIAGIELQQEMLHFCEEKKRCYFCSKKMTQKEIQMARDKVKEVRIKAQEKLEQMDTKKNEIQDGGSGGLGIDPQVMVKKLKEEIGKLNEKREKLQSQVAKYQQLKKYEHQQTLNTTLKRELQKCNLTAQILSKLSSIAQSDPRPDSYYESVSIEDFKEMCNAYQLKLTRYRSVKEQTNRLEENRQKNFIISKKRQQAIREKQELKELIERATEETKNYDFLKSSYTKLEGLIRMETRSKQNNKRGNPARNDTNKPIQSNPSSSQIQSYSSVQQAQGSLKYIYIELLKEKFYIEKLQVSINHFNDCQLLKQQRSHFVEVTAQLSTLAQQIQSSEKLKDLYNSMFHQWDKEAEKLKLRCSVITSAINEPLQTECLAMLNQSKHLEASILNLEQCYHLMEESVSQYHSQKMNEINRYIYQVWRDIYHGEDIEYIEIEAMVDGNSKKKKKNYNYKIMMKKNTKNFGNKQEMVEMRGRCSTGQKVLASIVIRLALAQVFCSSTRILALDQPTTNLDKEHIQNLALALLRLIELSGGKNLQLIIISHDIEFIKLLEQYADSYYEVKRDSNKFSTIVKKSIKDIFSGAIE